MKKRILKLSVFMLMFALTLFMFTGVKTYARTEDTSRYGDTIVNVPYQSTGGFTTNNNLCVANGNVSTLNYYSGTFSNLSGYLIFDLDSSNYGAYSSVLGCTIVDNGSTKTYYFTSSNNGYLQLEITKLTKINLFINGGSYSNLIWEVNVYYTKTLNVSYEDGYNDGIKARYSTFNNSTIWIADIDDGFRDEFYGKDYITSAGVLQMPSQEEYFRDNYNNLIITFEINEDIPSSIFNLTIDSYNDYTYYRPVVVYFTDNTIYAFTTNESIFTIDTSNYYNKYVDYITFEVQAPYDIRSLKSDSYSIGYEQGYNDASSKYYDDGYKNGLNDGSFIADETLKEEYDKGYNSGYNKGANETVRDYGLLDLFMAIGQAPIETMKGLFSFELFGIDLFNAFASIITLFIAIWLIRKFIL